MGYGSNRVQVSVRRVNGQCWVVRGSTSCCPRFSASAPGRDQEMRNLSNKQATLANEQHIERDHVEGLIAQNPVKTYLVAFVTGTP